MKTNLSNKSLVAQAHNHVQDARFFIDSDEREKAIESVEMLYNITEELYDRLLEEEKK
jgi:hypothetical protein